jgi:catechol 2,3-dioxygenase-like lactoylglutathione lyase family enzyme
MLSHVHVGTNDFGRGLAFYTAVLSELGWALKFVDAERPWAGWKPADQDRPLFLVGTPYNGEPAAPGNGQMNALLAASRSAVDAFYTTALAHGAVCEGPPRLRPEYHPDYYGAYVRDPDGNKLCACCHTPA